MAFGEILRNARIQKNLTLSDVAEGTHILVQIVEALEREETKRIAAAIYGRGFIKLCAEFLELDAEPLIQDFMDLYEGRRTPDIKLKPFKTPQVTAPVVTEPPVQAPSEVVIPPAKSVVSLPETTSLPKDYSQHPEDRMESFWDDQLVQAESEPVSHRDPLVEEEFKPEIKLRESGRAHSVVIMPENNEHEEKEAEPDLFKAPPRRTLKGIGNTISAGRKGEEITGIASGATKIPLFKIGGNIDTGYLRDDSRPKVGQRILSIIKIIALPFVFIGKLLLQLIPRQLPDKRILLITTGTVAAMVLLFFSVRVLFKATEKSVVEHPVVKVERILPPPELYVD